MSNRTGTAYFIVRNNQKPEKLQCYWGWADWCETANDYVTNGIIDEQPVHKSQIRQQRAKWRQLAEQHPAKPDAYYSKWFSGKTVIGFWVEPHRPWFFADLEKLADDVEKATPSIVSLANDQHFDLERYIYERFCDRLIVDQEDMRTGERLGCLFADMPYTHAARFIKNLGLDPREVERHDD